MKNKYYTKIKNEDINTIEIDYKKLPVFYRYFKINEHSVNSFLNDEIWATTPNAFNDPYDSIVCYNSTKIIQEIKKRLTEERKIKYRQMFNCRTNELAKKILSSITNEINEETRKIYCISCFSEVADSEIMWAHYSNNAKGFVLSYEGKDLVDLFGSCYEQALNIIDEFNFLDIKIAEKDKFCNIIPIQYESDKINITKEIVELLDFLLNNYDLIVEGKKLNFNEIYKLAENKENKKIFYSMMCKKSKQWSYEKECRFWGYNLNIFNLSPSPYVFMGKLKPKAIFLGEHISMYDEIALCTIAKEKKIDIYKMETKIYKNKCKLVSRKLL